MEITKEELDAINQYKNEKNLIINRLFISDVETDIALSQENENQYSKDALTENINIIKNIFIAIKKYSYNHPQGEDKILYKGTNIAEIDTLKNEFFLNHFWIANQNKENASSNLVRPVIMKIILDKNIPVIELENSQILISPFNELIHIEENEETEFLGSEMQEYTVTLKPQELQNLSEEDRNNLYENILNQSELVTQKINACISLDNDISIHYENIRKLEQLLSKHSIAMEQPNYEQETTLEEKQSDIDDIYRINTELRTIKNTITEVLKKRQEIVDSIMHWKRDILTFLKSEFKYIMEEYRVEETIDMQEEEVAEEIEEVEIPNEKPISFDDPYQDSVKAEALENVTSVENLLENIKNLIAKQQNHARIAESVDANYKAFNNAFEMRNQAEELESLVQAISNKIDNISPEKKEELEKISKTNLQISTLLNYLNNPKAAVTRQISRFDEMNIIEENELKREIAETIKNIRCESELKKLRDDIEIIEDKNTFVKLIGKITGKSKIDQTMLEQIEIRQKAIRKTFKTKMPLARNYSIHELIAEMDMFIKENKDDELVLEDVSNLRKIKETLKKNFVIIDSKVTAIINQKTGKNLPLGMAKISKKELIEIDTYRFLNKYGYDQSNDVKEPEYQDTLASEIKRIVDYIKTSQII